MFWLKICSFRDEGEANTIIHIPANDNADPAYDLYQHFEEACNFISKLHNILCSLTLLTRPST